MQKKYLKKIIIGGFTPTPYGTYEALNGQEEHDTDLLAYYFIYSRNLSDLPKSNNEITLFPIIIQSFSGFAKFKDDVIAIEYNQVITNMQKLLKIKQPQKGNLDRNTLRKQDEIVLFALNINQEVGRIEYEKHGREPLEAIAQVVLNRVNCGFGAKSDDNVITVTEIITTKNQFSWTSIENHIKSALNPKQAEKIVSEPPPKTNGKDNMKTIERAQQQSWLQSLDVAHEALTKGNIYPGIENATFYLNPSAKLGGQKWSRKAYFVKQVGSHCFYQPDGAGSGCTKKEWKLNRHPEQCPAYCDYK